MVKKQSPVKDRRNQLILIAFSHIVDRGFEGLRVHDVAAEAGINNATLHYYFPTKEDLIRGVVDHLIEEFSASYSFMPGAQGSLNAWEEIQAELMDARHNSRDARDQIVVFTELLIRSLRDPAIARIFKKLDESWRGYLAGIIERGIRQGVFRAELDPTITAVLIMVQIKGFGYQMLGETKQKTAEAVFNQLTLQVESWLTGEFKGQRKPGSR